MGNLKDPIEYKFDLNTKSQPKVLCVTHTDDFETDILKVGVYQGNLKYDLLQTVITARMVMRWTHELLADNVACTLSESCDILIPIDSSAIPVRAGEMLVEINIRSIVDDEALTLQFPLIVRVNGSILDNAEVTPDSRGTIPELLQEVEQELKRVEGYVDEAKVFEILDNALSGNRNISPTLLVDNVTDQTHNPNGDLIMYYIDSDDIRHNIFNFTPYLGTKNYNALQNRPVVTGSDVSTGVNAVLEGYLNFSAHGFLVSTYQASDKEIDVDLAASVPNCRTTSDYSTSRYNFDNIAGIYARAGVFLLPSNRVVNKPAAISDIVSHYFIIHLASPAADAAMIRYVVGETAENKIVTYMQTATLFMTHASNYEVLYQSDWQKIGEKGDKGDDGFSPTVSTTSEYLRTRVEITDVNGTHNFFVNDGESVKSAIIDANGDLKITIQGKPSGGVHPTYPERIYNVGHVVGADGSDYILTAQDKSDIADLVLAELPTTQGVQYGNAGN